MAKIQRKTEIDGVEQVEETKVLRTIGRFFKLKWWETDKIDSIGSSIYIKTDHLVKEVYLNGELLTNNK